MLKTQPTATIVLRGRDSRKNRRLLLLKTQPPAAIVLRPWKAAEEQTAGRTGGYYCYHCLKAMEDSRGTDRRKNRRLLLLPLS